MNQTLASILYDNKQIGWKRGGSSDFTAQINAPAYKLSHAGPISTLDWRRNTAYNWEKPKFSSTYKSPGKSKKDHSRSKSFYDPNNGGTFNGLCTQPLKNLNETMYIDRKAPQFTKFMENTVNLQGYKKE